LEEKSGFIIETMGNNFYFDYAGCNGTTFRNYSQIFSRTLTYKFELEFLYANQGTLDANEK
jgi:hypothetical protein